jgi:DNA helicase-2/ATP-dependent DNA helicase PcrA
LAARRGGFSDFFEPLYKISNFKTGLLDGKLSGISFFSQQVLPLVQSLQARNKFSVAQVIKKYSPLVSAERLRNSESSFEEIRKANTAVQSLFSFWNSDADPLLIQALKEIASSNLFAIPEVFEPIVSREDTPEDESEFEDSSVPTDINPKIDAWDKALSVPFSQLEAYVQYISDKSAFGTHQGIKGLQFPRVMVILDDNEARGFMFSYDKLFGAKSPSSADQKNAHEGRETSIDRTRRLFYVTCSRAQSSLAVVVYTKEMDKIRDHLHIMQWYDDDEIVCMP